MRIGGSVETRCAASPPPFAYHRPDDLEGALSLLAEHGYDASVLAGGQSLVPVLSLRVARPTHIIDLNRISGLDNLGVDDGMLVLGPMVRQRTALESELVHRECPLLAEALEHVGHPETRNRGTVVGSLVHADPAAEIGTVAVACDAELVLPTAAPYGLAVDRSVELLQVVERLESSGCSDDRRPAIERQLLPVLPVDLLPRGEGGRLGAPRGRPARV